MTAGRGRPAAIGLHAVEQLADLNEGNAVKMQIDAQQQRRATVRIQEGATSRSIEPWMFRRSRPLLCSTATDELISAPSIQPAEPRRLDARGSAKSPLHRPRTGSSRPRIP